MGEILTILVGVPGAFLLAAAAFSGPYGRNH